MELVLLPVGSVSNVDDLPPLLHGHYPASSLLRGSPSLSVASVLLASRLLRLCLVWALCCEAHFQSGDLFFLLSSSVSLFDLESRFFAPTHSIARPGARRSCQGWPSHRPFQVLCPCQATP